MNRFPKLIGGLLLLGSLGAIGGVAAGDHGDSKNDKQARKLQNHLDARAALQRGEILPLARILEVVAKRMPGGDVIEIELERDKRTGAFSYEVKVLDREGIVRKVTLDAKLGTVISVEND